MKGSDQTCRTAVIVETLIAVAVLAVAFNLLVRFAFAGAQQASSAGSRARAALLAQEKMEELTRHIDRLPQWRAEIAERYPLDEESGYYLLQDEDRALRWSWDAVPYESAEGLEKLSVRVVFAGPHSRDRREEHFSLSALQAHPCGLRHGGEEVSE